MDESSEFYINVARPLQADLEDGTRIQTRKQKQLKRMREQKNIASVNSQNFKVKLPQSHNF
jgi:hypothetical protein